MARLAAAAGVELLDVVEEVESGSRRDRPQLARAIERARRERLALVAPRLDRISRVASHLLAIRDAVERDGVELITGDIPPGLDRASRALIVTIFAGIAEHERERISERTRAALASAKARGVRLGAPPAKIAAATAKARAARQRRAAEHAEQLRPIVEYLLREHPGASVAQLAQLLEERAARGPRGGSRWSYAQAERLLHRLGIRPAA